MSEEPTLVRIGADHMYQEVRRLSDGLIRVEEKLDRLLTADQNVERRLEDHEGRIRGLEERKWPVAQVAVITGACSAAAALATFLLQN